MEIKNVKFQTSVYNKKDLKFNDKKQIVLVGKSNVGKSSFINAICNNGKIAKVGNTPGKTKSINFYNVNDSFYIVDLPGYGYSKMSMSEKENVANLVNFYINSGNICHVFFIVDIRHKPTDDDKDMYNYLVSYNIPFTIIANKADKLSKKAADENVKVIIKELFAKEDVVIFSSENKVNLDEIKKIIDCVTND